MCRPGHVSACTGGGTSRCSGSASPPPNHVTSPKFLGRHSVTLKLTAGQWFYFSPSQKKTYFIVHT
jgi:hypothetical protein